MKYGEKVCQQALSSLLRDSGTDHDWSGGNDPPDFFLEVSDQRFAVEVTSIHGTTRFESGGRTWTQLSNELLQFGKEVCHEVQAGVAVQGCFVVSLPPVTNLKKRKPEIVKALVDYLDTRGREAEPMTDRAVYQADSRKITVWKMRREGSSLVARALPTGAYITRWKINLWRCSKGQSERRFIS